MKARSWFLAIGFLASCCISTRVAALTLEGVPPDAQVFCGETVPVPSVTVAGGCESNNPYGLVLHFTFDSSTVTDEAGSRSGMVYGAQWTPNGRFGGAFEFYGSNDYIIASDAGLPEGDQARTISMWVAVDALQGDNSTDFFSYGTRTLSSFVTLAIDWRLDRDSFSFSPWGYVVLSNTKVVQTSTWFHIAYVYGGAGIQQWYVNGKEATELIESQQDLATALSGVLRIGSQTYSVHPFVGRIDDVRVYGRELMPSEIATLAASSLTTPQVRFAEVSTGDCPGEIRRVWTATDGCGNSVSATQKISVLPKTEPLQLVGVPSDTTVECGAVPEAPTVTATSGCSKPIVMGLALNPANGHTYQVVPGVVSWAEASNLARVVHGTLTGYLATITSSQEQAFVESILPTSNLGSVVYARIGGFEAGEGNWQWITGEPLSYTNFQNGEPNGGTNENFLSIVAVQGGKGHWNDTGDESIGNIGLYVVEWDGEVSPGTPVVTFSATTNGTCPAVITRVWTATDGCGATVSATQAITVVDNDPPTLAGVPPNSTLYCGEAIPAADVTAMDAGNGTVPVIVSVQGTGTCPAVVTRVWTATDSCGNSVAATQTITLVNRSEPLALVGVPEDVVVRAGEIPAVASVTTTGGCPREVTPGLAFDPRNGHTYRVATGLVSWVEASNLARVVYGSLTGHLATITSSQEQAFVESILPTSIPRYVMYARLGGFESEEGNWRWITGEPLSYTNFTNGEPNGWTNENYLSLIATPGGKGYWNDTGNAAAAEVELYVIEWDGEIVSGSLLQTFSTTTNGSCPVVIKRVWTAMDGCGSSVSATQTITVLDDERPVLVGVPSNVVLYCGDEIPSANVTAMDTGLGSLAVTVELRGTGACPAVVSRVWSAVDSCGNAAVATQKLTFVSDTRDLDEDGLTAEQERRLGTDPANPDTDGDGRSDGVEVKAGTDPRKADSYPLLVRNDFDGDLKSDIGVVDMRSGYWYLLQSKMGRKDVQFGYFGLRPLTGDFDNDGHADLALFDSNGGWWYWYSVRKNKVETFYRGEEGSVGFVGDFDGDGKTDTGAYYPFFGLLTVSSPGYKILPPLSLTPNSTPVVADFDGDGKDGVAVFQPSSGKWSIVDYGKTWSVRFGGLGALPIAADVDGDRKADLCLYFRNTGQWRIRLAKGGVVTTSTAKGGVPVTGDYDGDQRADIGSYVTATGVWTIRGSKDGLRTLGFGFNGAWPVGTAP